VPITEAERTPPTARLSQQEWPNNVPDTNEARVHKNTTTERATPQQRQEHHKKERQSVVDALGPGDLVVELVNERVVNPTSHVRCLRNIDDFVDRIEERLRFPLLWNTVVAREVMRPTSQPVI
jgi:hypothetical protein